MVFYETLRSSRTPATFFVTSRFQLSRPVTQTHLKEPDTFIYLDLKLDPVLSMDQATQHIKKKINWAYLTITAVAHSIRYDNSLRSRTTRSSPLILFHIWQACVLPFATQNLRYLCTPTQLQTIQTALTNSLQRILRSYTIAEILLLEFGVPHLRLQQACQLISLHYKYTISHTHLVAAHLYRIYRQSLLSNRDHHLHQSTETRTADAHTLFSLKSIYINPHTTPQVAQAKPRNRNKPFANFLKAFAITVWHKDIHRNHPASQDNLPSTCRTKTYFKIMHHSLKTNLPPLPLHYAPLSPQHHEPLQDLRTKPWSYPNARLAMNWST